MMSKILFSIIIPVYNKERYIRDTIESVLKQTYDYFELIIVDDGSTDSSLIIINEFAIDSRIKIFSISNSGVSYSRNYGISQASGDYVCFLDGDDIWTKDHLSIFCNSILKHPEVSFFTSAFQLFDKIIDASGRVINFSQNNTEFVDDYFKLCVSNKGPVCLTSSVVVKKHVIDEYSLKFNELYTIGEDLDFWVNIALHSDVCYIPKVTMYYRQDTPGGLTVSVHDVKKCFPYRDWFDLNSNSSYFHSYVNRQLYTQSLIFYKEGQFRTSVSTILKMRGTDLLIRRYLLLILSLSKQCMAKLGF